MLKIPYPCPEDDARIAELLQQKEQLEKQKLQVERELRRLIYKAEGSH